MTHVEYQEHIQKHPSEPLSKDNELNSFLHAHKDICSIIINLNPDAVADILEQLYCPIIRRKHRDPLAMLRSLLLMTLLKIACITDPRYYPPLDRNSEKFKEIAKRRSATERLNSVIDSYDLDHRCRYADYGLIQLTFVEIVIHARIRYEEAVKKSSEDALFNETMEKNQSFCPPTLTQSSLRK
jgi:hypothetical protein